MGIGFSVPWNGLTLMKRSRTKEGRTVKILCDRMGADGTIEQVRGTIS